MYCGTFTALVTPFRQGEVDVKQLCEFVEFQLSEGIDGVIPCGTTGETPTLSDAEQALVIRTVVEHVRKRVPVIAGAGANATKKAIEASKMAKECGADGLLHVTPYYNKPTQAGLIAHFQAIHEATNLPIILYNVPGRTGGDLLPETIATLAKLPRIVAVKEATGSLARGGAVIAACPKDFSVLSGDDATALALTALGGQGVISVISNVAPKLTTQMIKKALENDLVAAREMHYRLLTLMDLMFIESNPIPVKAGVSLLGYCTNEVRLPLLPLSGEKFERVKAEMKQVGLIR